VFSAIVFSKEASIMKLLVFAGSTRLQSYNRQLARAAAAMAREQGVDVTLLELGSLDIPLYNADLEAQGTPPDVIRSNSCCGNIRHGSSARPSTTPG
jgi:hypothetical protein